MSTTLKQNAAGMHQHEAVDDTLIEKVWQDLDGEASHEQIRAVINEVALKYEDAPVQTFVPILIHRRALEQLRSLCKVNSYPAASQKLGDGRQHRGKEIAAAPIINKQNKRKITMKKLTHLLHLSILILMLAACSGTAVEMTSVVSAAAESMISTEAGTRTVAVTAPITVSYDSEDLETSAVNAAATTIDLDGDVISVSGEGAVVNGGTLTITSAGTCSMSGVLTNGQIVVETADSDPVILFLDGVDITNETGAPIYVSNA
ncbi:MAG: carbohydrate-binding domain-containing protein, partial [Candidatus Promineifilaceae bacterium]